MGHPEHNREGEEVVGVGVASLPQCVLPVLGACHPASPVAGAA